MNRYKGEGIQNLMMMEEFDDVKTLDEEIDKLMEQAKELGRCQWSSHYPEKMGKDDLVSEMQLRINDKMEIKASLQALHLKEEQLKMPEGLK